MRHRPATSCPATRYCHCPAMLAFKPWPYSQFASQDVRPGEPKPWKILAHIVSNCKNVIDLSIEKGARATQPLEQILCWKLLWSELGVQPDHISYQDPFKTRSDSTERGWNPILDDWQQPSSRWVRKSAVPDCWCLTQDAIYWCKSWAKVPYPHQRDSFTRAEKSSQLADWSNSYARFFHGPDPWIDIQI